MMTIGVREMLISFFMYHSSA